jgi:hypothetical protein
MTPATLSVGPDGTIQGLYTEAIDLSALGTMEVRRATTIEFDNRLQAWRVFDPDGYCLYCSPSRETCLSWERQHLNWELDNS